MKYKTELILFAIACILFGAATIYNRVMPVFLKNVDFGEYHQYIGGFIILIGVACFYLAILKKKKD